RALRADDSQDARRLFCDCARALSQIPDDDEFRDLACRAMSEAWARPGDLAAVCITLVKQNPAIAELLACDGNEMPVGCLEALGRDALLCGLLRCTVACDVELERLLTRARYILLRAAMDADHAALSVDSLTFACSLAAQCFINEYVFAITAGEDAAVARLRASLADAMASGGDTPPLGLAALAAYLPLHVVPNAVAPLDRDWPPCVAALLNQQIREPQRETTLSVTLSRVTEIDDEVSLQVQQQYEENP